MSEHRITPDEIQSRKQTDKPIVCLTSYTTPSAQIIDPVCDLILVGDSLGMVLYGLPDTTGVTLDMMIRHGQAVMRGSQNACVIVDMPFGTYESGAQHALINAQKIYKETGCNGVKLEGGQDMAPMIKTLADHSIPVMGHIGLLPQSAPQEGGFKIKGRTEEEVQRLLNDAKAVEDAGAFALVIEGTIESVSKKISESVSIPTIGIGASPHCDGQILVTEDLLGITPRQPKFVKKYADLQPTIKKAVSTYADEVRSHKFPGKDQVYT